MGDVYPAPYSDAAQTAVVVKYHKVPRDLIGALLPSAAICVNDFLAFNLPQLCVPSNLGDASACLAWSSSPPSSTLSAKLLESLKLPEPEKLYRFLVSAPPKGTQSVRVNSLEFPLGILAVWETYLRAQQLRKYWSQSRRWLEESMRCEPAHSRVFQVALQLFDELKWGAPIYGFKADNLCTSTATLTRILSFSWLATSNIAHMLDLVQTDINDHGLPVRIVDPYFAEKLLMLSGKDANYYRTHSSQRHLRRLGEQFVKGEIQNLAGVVNVDGNHWIAFIANAGAREILIADSMVPRNSLSPSFTRYYPLTKALQWWIFHSSELAGLDITPYSVERPEVSQQTDSNSCGIYAVNYVASYFLPSVYDPLVPMSMRCPRTAAFISIAQRHISSEGEDFSWYLGPPDSFITHKEAQIPGIREDYILPHAAPDDPSASLGSGLGDGTGVNSNDHCHVPSSPEVIPVREFTSPVSSNQNLSVTAPSPSLAPLMPLQSIRSTTAPAPALRPTSSGNGRITSFFGRLKDATAEEQEHFARKQSEDFDIIRQNRQEIHDRTKKAAEVKAESIRKAAALRKQKSRTKKRGLEIEAGERTQDGKLIKKVKLNLKDAQIPDVHMIAEASRPRAVIKDGYCLTGSSMKLGKVKRKPRRRSGRIDWKTPLLFAKIQQVASLPHLSALRSPTEMLKELRRRDPCFQYLSSQVLGRMFTPGKHLPKEFSEETLEQVANRAQFSPKASSRKGILAPHPDVIDSITDTLTSLRAAGVPLNLKTVRSIIISHIEDKAPFLFTRVARDGSRFTASERWCRCFLKNELGWSVRHSTQAAQKIPDNVDELLLKAAIRQAHAIKQWNIPSELRVNSDQTQVILNEGSGLTWNKAGVKQVLCHGRDEKRAFTLLVGLSESGTLLPFQSMWSGKTAVSTPDADSDGYEQSIQEGFLYEFTKTDTYWSTIGTMKSYVVLILVPYFNGEKERLGRSPNQPCIWQIDVWPVHASDEFRTWMWNQYPWIIIFYVPAGCTGLFQPSDVGMQRILKQAISRKQTADLVEEVMQQLEREDPLPANKIKIDTRVRSLRNRSPGWLVAAHNACKDPKIVRAAFRNCKAGDFNLSQESLTSIEMLELLCSLPSSDPEFFKELNRDPRKSPAVDPRTKRSTKFAFSVDDPDEFSDETPDEPPFTTLPGDDEDIPVSDIIDHVVLSTNDPKKYLEDEGSLRTLAALAEEVEYRGNATFGAVEGDGSDDESDDDSKDIDGVDCGSDGEYEPGRTNGVPSIVGPESLVAGRTPRARKAVDKAHDLRHWQRL